MDATGFAQASLRTSTYAQYSRLWRKFADLAASRGFVCLPVDARHCEVILSDFASETKSVSSTQKMVAAVSFFHRLHNFQPPLSTARGRLVLRGITRAFSKPVRRAPPLTPDIVKTAIYYQIGSDLDRSANFAVPLLTWRTVAQLVLSFSALARYHCLTNIFVTDVVFINSGVQLTFWNTKTDVLNQGQKVFVSPVPNSFACPVRFLAAYMFRLNWEAFPYVGPLFPGLTAPQGARGFSSLPPNPRAFSKQGATLAMRRHLMHIGVPNASSFTLHSGRRGGATQAALGGCDFLAIKRQGRWASDSCPQMYIDEAATLQSNFSSFLGL